MTMTKKISNLGRKFCANKWLCFVTLFVFAFALINSIMFFTEETNYLYFGYSEATYASLEAEANSIISNTEIATDSSNLRFELSSEDSLCIVKAKIENLGEPNEKIEISRNFNSKTHRILVSEGLFALISAFAAFSFWFISVLVLIFLYYCCKGLSYIVSKVKKYFT